MKVCPAGGRVLDVTVKEQTSTHPCVKKSSSIGERFSTLGFFANNIWVKNVEGDNVTSGCMGTFYVKIQGIIYSNIHKMNS